MKALALACALMLAGCAMTPTQKRVAAVVGTAVVIGAVATHGGSDLATIAPPAGLPCHVQPDGSCR